MDQGGRENRRQRLDCFHWNTISQYQFKEQNDFDTNAEITMLADEKDLAIRERDRALAEKKAALKERDVAIQQRDAAMAERDTAIRQRDNAIAALRFQENTMNSVSSSGRARGSNKRIKQHTYHRSNNNGTDDCVIDASPVSTIPFGTCDPPQETNSNIYNNGSLMESAKSPKKAKKKSEDLNRHVTTQGTKAERDADRDFGLMTQIQFNKHTMLVPVCSCTGVARRCYKWGNGGWQSSCCTTSLSVYPLPQVPNKRHARTIGRKMSGAVFSRLLTRLVASGRDLSIPLDLKNYWAKHGTNRYITIK